MKPHRYIYLGILLLIFNSWYGCSDEFLNLKRDKTQAVPSTIQDFQALLNNFLTMNYTSSIRLNTIGADEYYVLDDVYDLLSKATQKNAYTWAEDIFEGESSDDWNFAYKRVLYANTVLDGIEKIDPPSSAQLDWNNVKGSALFFRAYSFYRMAQTFARQYDPETAASDLGIPLRLDPDITLPVTRASVAETYEQIIGDLKQATQLLPEVVELKQRPPKSAAYALLAKTYLHIQNYAEALVYADSCIRLNDGLLDYSTLDSTAKYTFSEYQYGAGNKEVLFLSAMSGVTILSSSRFRINPDIYASFKSGDLRKQLFFSSRNGNGSYIFKGSYIGAYAFFAGLALDEVYLIRAECYARMNEIGKALADINYLLENRYQKDAFIPFMSDNAQEVLREIIKERGKQLLCRGVRWEDLRRLNKDKLFARTLVREVNGIRYELKPESPRYVWPIPDDVIALSKLEQNLR